MSATTISCSRDALVSLAPARLASAEADTFFAGFLQTTRSSPDRWLPSALHALDRHHLLKLVWGRRVAVCRRWPNPQHRLFMGRRWRVASTHTRGRRKPIRMALKPAHHSIDERGLEVE